MLRREEGFTLIELMIVIAIIGVLAAIAIPNFIEYRNKSYCTMVAGDAQAMKGAIGAYFANPSRNSVDTMTHDSFTPKVKLSGSTASLTQATGSDMITITLTATGDGTKCKLGTKYVSYLGSNEKGGWK